MSKTICKKNCAKRGMISSKLIGYGFVVKVIGLIAYSCWPDQPLLLIPSVAGLLALSVGIFIRPDEYRPGYTYENFNEE